MSSVFATSKGAACEPPRLIVQVVGKDHPPTQRLVIYSVDNNEEQEWLTQQDKPEAQSSTNFSSVLHTWDWEGQPLRNLWLHIDAEQGGRILVPLFENLKATPRQPEHGMQWNQIVPVVPMTALPGTKSDQDLGTPVQVRNGYVYVFYKGRLWRELEVRQQGSATTFHDIDVMRYRRGKGFKSGPRQATGVGLADIWLPAQYNNAYRSQEAPQLCFSEVQLSAARLQRLEQEAGLRGSRCNTPDLRASQPKYKKLFDGKADGKAMLEAFSNCSSQDPGKRLPAERVMPDRLVLGLHAFPVALAAPQRLRQPGYEWLLEHPARHLCDLSGAWLAQAKQTAAAFLEGCASGNSQVADPLLEGGLLRHLLQQQLEQAKATEASLWEAQPTETDSLQAARQRQLWAVLLDDPMYRIRHIKQHLQDQQQLLLLFVQQALRYPHHNSAFLIQQQVLPATVGGQPNPLTESLEKITDAGRRDINRFTATAGRTHVWRQLRHAQSHLSASLESTRYQQALADHLSLDGYEYLAELHALSQVFPLLVIAAARIDPLAGQGVITDALTGLSTGVSGESGGAEWVNRVANQNTHPLHAMIWPDYTLEALATPYQGPREVEINQGNGRFRPDELAKFEKLPPPSTEPATLNAALLTELLNGGSLHNALVVSAKACANALHEVYGNFQGAIQTAEAAVTRARFQQGHGAVQEQHARQAHASSQAEQQRSAQARQAAEQHQRQAAEGQRQAEAATRQQQQTRQQVQGQVRTEQAAAQASARVGNLRLHGMGAEQLRGMLREGFGQLVFTRRSATDKGAYYVLGVADYPAQSGGAVRMYGEFQGSNGNLLGSTNARTTARGGLPAATGEHFLFLLPRNSPVAQRLIQLNQTLNAALRAEEALRSAQTQAAAQAERAAQQAESARTTERAASQRVQQAEAALRSAQLSQQQAESALQGELKRLQHLENNPFYRILNNRLFPASVVLLELYNVQAELKGMEGTASQKGQGRASAGVFNAGVDLLLAMEALAFKMAANNKVLKAVRKPLIVISRDSAIRWLGQALGESVATVIVARMFVSAGASLLMAAIALYDAWEAAGRNDDAKWGYLMIAGGALLGAIGTFVTGGSAILGPFGILALALIVGGAALVYWLSNTPLEDWLVCGPFGSNREHPHLQDPQQAFYRLLGLFAGPFVQALPNPHFQRNAKLDPRDPIPYAVRSSNTLLRIETALPGLLSTSEGLAMRVECWLRATEYARHPSYNLALDAVESESHTLHLVTPAAKVTWPGALELYVKTLPDHSVSVGSSRTDTVYDWALRIQSTLTTPEGEWVFPAPAPLAPPEQTPRAFAEQPHTYHSVQRAPR
ncbi:hypothetical protein [Metapseudomonas otitidis]|uniref:hypothetical protein n=1 Tax=Metapseudomonas otitidis TaxID=319939 RepID=UPI0013F6127A|nr:hypothetical protein [Pseudomonas otitidis]